MLRPTLLAWFTLGDQPDDAAQRRRLGAVGRQEQQRCRSGFTSTSTTSSGKRLSRVRPGQHLELLTVVTRRVGGKTEVKP